MDNELKHNYFEEATQTHDPKTSARVDDPVNHPSHYTFGGIECIDAIHAALGKGFKYFLQGQVLKYLWRYEHKGKPVQDLEKANWYNDRLIKEMKETGHDN